jgi:hypothetical protein
MTGVVPASVPEPVPLVRVWCRGWPALAEAEPASAGAGVVVICGMVRKKLRLFVGAPSLVVLPLAEVALLVDDRAGSGSSWIGW